MEHWESPTPGMDPDPRKRGHKVIGREFQDVVLHVILHEKSKAKNEIKILINSSVMTVIFSKEPTCTHWRIYT